MNRIFPKQFIVSIAGIAYLLVTASLIRLGFYLTNLDYFTTLSFSEIALAFLAGIRFDISGILYFVPEYCNSHRLQPAVSLSC